MLHMTRFYDCCLCSVDDTGMPLFSCDHCGESVTTFTSFLKHVRLFHAHEPHFSVRCTLRSQDIDSCKTFQNVEVYRTHVYRNHHDCTNNDWNIKVANGHIFDIVCPLCHQLIADYVALSKHYSLHCQHGEKVTCIRKQCFVIMSYVYSINYQCFVNQLIFGGINQCLKPAFD